MMTSCVETPSTTVLMIVILFCWKDFLGSSAAARTFTDRYITYRFPSIASSSSNNPGSLPQPGPGKISDSRGSSKTGTPSTSIAPPGSSNIPDALNAAFGPEGRVHQKNREADLTASGGKSWPRSTPPGSGSQTPITSQGHNRPVRAVGAVTVQIQEPKGKAPRIDHQQPGMALSKGKDKEKIWDVPRSKAMKRLEGMMTNLRVLQAGEGKMKAEEKMIPDCFCQGTNASRYSKHR